MDIKDFVSDVLIGIIEGAMEARAKVKPIGAKINPNVFRDEKGNAVERNDMLPIVGIADFDIALTVSDKIGADGKAGISVLSIKVGASASGSLESSQVSRVKFNIPYMLPEFI